MPKRQRRSTESSSRFDPSLEACKPQWKKAEAKAPRGEDDEPSNHQKALAAQDHELMACSLVSEFDEHAASAAAKGQHMQQVEKGNPVISLWRDWQYFPGAVKEVLKDGAACAIEFCDGDTCEADLWEMAIDREPNADAELMAGVRVLFVQGLYTEQEGDKPEPRWHEGVVTAVRRGEGGEFLVDGQHLRGVRDKKWCEYADYDENFEGLSPSSLRICYPKPRHVQDAQFEMTSPGEKPKAASREGRAVKAVSLRRLARREAHTRMLKRGGGLAGLADLRPVMTPRGAAGGAVKRLSAVDYDALCTKPLAYLPVDAVVALLHDGSIQTGERPFAFHPTTAKQWVFKELWEGEHQSVRRQGGDKYHSKSGQTNSVLLPDGEAPSVRRRVGNLELKNGRTKLKYHEYTAVDENSEEDRATSLFHVLKPGTGGGARGAASAKEKGSGGARGKGKGPELELDDGWSSDIDDVYCPNEPPTDAPCGEEDRLDELGRLPAQLRARGTYPDYEEVHKDPCSEFLK